MTEIKARIADLGIKVNGIYSEAVQILAPFQCDSECTLHVKISEADVESERRIYISEHEYEGIGILDLPDWMLESTAIQRKITEKFFEYDILLFHGSVIAVDGVAYLFTAKSGTGKSTHTRLWREMFGERAVMVNDDKPFLKFTDEGVIACGSPWNGKHRLGTNIMVPLKAICVLERGESNVITRIDPKDALQMLFQQSSRPMNRMLMPKYMELVDRLANSVEFYRLKCNMSPEAARVSYEGMSGI